MRLLSQIFQPVITIPKNAKIKNTEITCKSQKLLLECGLVRPTSSGLFTLLPLARRALDKLEALAREALEAVGAQRMSLPSLTAAALWEKTGRLDDIGAELMKVEDRHGKKYLLAPTHEEAIADLLADVGPVSYKQLPLLLYQISDKYRDEARPKHGVLRARAFSMLDAYGAHASRACAEGSYARVSAAYRELFKALRLPVHQVSAPSGAMGGSHSHEWQLCADAGEDVIRICGTCARAAREEDGDACTHCGNGTERLNSIEVGHTFILGDRYSAPLRAQCVPAAGAPQPLLMSCYGIGITRLLAASLEALSTETSMRWPHAIAPFNTIIIGPKEGSKEWHRLGTEGLRQAYTAASLASPGDVLLDDRHQLTVGKRLMMADRMGYPNIVVCGRAILDKVPKYELHRCSSDQTPPQLLTLDQLPDTLRSSKSEINNDCIANLRSEINK